MQDGPECAETGTCSPQCVKCNPNSAVSGKVPPKPAGDFPAPTGEHPPPSPCSSSASSSSSYSTSTKQVKTAQTLPKHNFLLPARVFLEERDEEEQPPVT